MTRKLFDKFSAFLASSGFEARKGQIVDATIVRVPIQRNTRKENEDLLKKLAENEIVQEKYLYCRNSSINDGIREAYSKIFPATDPNDIVQGKDDRNRTASKKAMMAHLEKMLFMMKEHVMLDSVIQF